MPASTHLSVAVLMAVLLNGCTFFSGSSSIAKADLATLMARRLGWMDQVAQAKQARALPVNDPKREAELLAAMTKLGAASGLPAGPVKAFFVGQMQAAKVRQEEWLNAHPAAAQKGKAVPDLAKTIRPALDQISKLMILRLAQARAEHGSSQVVLDARQKLEKDGYSAAVVTPAIRGLEAGLAGR